MLKYKPFCLRNSFSYIPQYFRTNYRYFGSVCTSWLSNSQHKSDCQTTNSDFICSWLRKYVYVCDPLYFPPSENMRKCVCARKCIDIIRMFSSRMRTARSLTVSREGVSDRECLPEGVSAPGVSAIMHLMLPVCCPYSNWDWRAMHVTWQGMLG